MRIVRSAGLEFVPAGHENPADPGALKKVLVAKDDLQPGRIQMINWARIPAGKSFARHYHEDMQEIFIVVSGQVEITAGAQSATLAVGDAVLIEAREVHTMRNLDSAPTDYLAIGVALGTGGRTVLVD